MRARLCFLLPDEKSPESDLSFSLLLGIEISIKRFSSAANLLILLESCDNVDDENTEDYDRLLVATNLNMLLLFGTNPIPLLGNIKKAMFILELFADPTLVNREIY